MKYVIIGNSFAGMFAVEAIRRHDSEGDILVVSREPQHVYSRAMIHEMLSGVVEEPMVYLRDWDFYDRMHVRTLLGREATAIDTEKQTVTVGGDEIEYNKLLLATGGAPFVPPIDGLEDVNYYTFTTLSEAQRLKKACNSRKNVVVLGAGLIGLQCAEALRHLGMNVTVVEMADSVLPMALDDQASEIVERELREEGIDIHTANTIDNIQSKGGKPTACVLKDDEEVPCDVLVIAVGVRPDVAMAKDAGITVERGIVVNDRMETNVDNIYAAGDCAQGPEIVSGVTMNIPVIPIASTQGMIAGYNMAGAERDYRGGMQLNSLQFGDVQIISYGFIKDDRDAEVFTKEDPERKVYRKVIVKNGIITGALFVKDVDRAGLFRHLIEKKIDVSGFKNELLARDFGVAHLPKDVRDEMFTVPQ